MQIFEELNKNKGLSLALGFFDGVHLGHQAVIKNAVDYASENKTKSAIITFQDHPCCYFYDVEPKYIIRKHNKFELFEKMGVDYVYSLKFDEYIASMNADEYLQKVLIKNFEPKAVTTGFNHFFGVKKAGNVDYLRKMQGEFNYSYFEIQPVLLNGEIVSSTRIREDIALGNMELVNSMLGYNYFLEETVVHGEQLGRQIGFKTANLLYPKILVQPAKGVYKVTVEIEGKTYKAIANYGNRPTVSKDEFSVLEVHILDFDEDIYGKKIKVDFIKKIRDEKKFTSTEELKKQIQEDIKNSYLI